MEIDDELDEARRNYFSGRQSKMTDAEFDVLEKYSFTAKVGHSDRKSVPLPKQLSTLKKLNQEDLVLKWEKKWALRLTMAFSEKDTNFIYMDKIDGIHCLLHYSAVSTTPKAFTRGNGKYGTDITHFNIKTPKLVVQSDVFVEGELVMNEADFLNHCSDKASARTAVAGIFNANQPSHGIAWVRFIAFDIVQSQVSPVPMLEQLKLLQELQFDTCPFKPMKNIDWPDILEELQTTSPYKKDGVVIAVNCPVTKFNWVSELTADHDFKIAVKPMMGDCVADTIVTRIEWNSSKDQRQIPTIHFQELVFDNVVVRKCTGHNSDFIACNKIGVGAIILVSYETRVPVLKRVIVGCTNENHLKPPPVNRTSVFQKRLEAFFKRMETFGIGRKTCMLLAEKCLDKIKNFRFSNGNVMKRKHIVNVLWKNTTNIDTFVKCNALVKTLLNTDGETHEEAERLQEFVEQKPLIFQTVDLTLFRALFTLTKDELGSVERKKDFLYDALHVHLGRRFKGHDLLNRLMSAMFIFGGNIPIKSVEKRLKECDRSRLESLVMEIGFSSVVIAEIQQ